MNHIVEGLGVIGTAPNGGSTKVAIIKARVLDSFARKETKILKKCGHACTKLKHTWKLNPSKWIGSKSISLKPSSRNTHGIGGCPRNRKHLTSLKPSHGKSSSCD
jgi:hypothetical protein